MTLAQIEAKLQIAINDYKEAVLSSGEDAIYDEINNDELLEDFALFLQNDGVCSNLDEI